MAHSSWRHELGLAEPHVGPKMTQQSAAPLLFSSPKTMISACPISTHPTCLPSPKSTNTSLSRDLAQQLTAPEGKNQPPHKINLLQKWES